MDTNEYPSLGRLARLNAQLSVQSARVHSIVASQLDEVERLFRAATERDWDAVARASRELAGRASERGHSALARSAGKVCEALRSDPSGAKAARPLAQLLDACRVAKQRMA